MFPFLPFFLPRPCLPIAPSNRSNSPPIRPIILPPLSILSQWLELTVFVRLIDFHFKNFTYLTLPATGAAEAKPLLKTKLRLAAVKALREAELNNLGKTIVINFGNLKTKRIQVFFK